MLVAAAVMLSLSVVVFRDFDAANAKCPQFDLTTAVNVMARLVLLVPIDELTEHPPRNRGGVVCVEKIFNALP
jgi:hypothetical protein